MGRVAASGDNVIKGPLKLLSSIRAGAEPGKSEVKEPGCG